MRNIRNIRDIEDSEGSVKDMFEVDGDGIIYEDTSHSSKIGKLRNGRVEIVISSPFLHDGLAGAVELGAFCERESIPSTLTMDYEKMSDVSGPYCESYMKEYLQFFNRALYVIDRDKSN